MGVRLVQREGKGRGYKLVRWERGRLNLKYDYTISILKYSINKLLSFVFPSYIHNIYTYIHIRYSHSYIVLTYTRPNMLERRRGGGTHKYLYKESFVDLNYNFGWLK